MSDDSTRRVQNKVIKKYVDEKLQNVNVDLDSVVTRLDTVIELLTQIKDKPSGGGLTETEMIYF